MVEIIEDKSATIAARESGDRQRFSACEIASYWFARGEHGLSSATASLLRQACAFPRSYLWNCLGSRALCTFALDAHPRSLPAYNHSELGETFGALDRIIRSHLDLVVPANCLTIPLDREDDSYWNGEIPDRRAFDRVLGVRSSALAAALIDRTPSLVKVCSREFVSKLVQRALPDLALTHLPSPPSAISPNVETQYFAITKAGPCWDHIRQTNFAGIYIPQEIPDAEAQLNVIL